MERQASERRGGLEPELLSNKQAAKVLNVSRPVFNRWVAAGYIKRVKSPDSKRKMVRRSDLLEFIDSLELEQGEPPNTVKD